MLKIREARDRDSIISKMYIKLNSPI